MAWYWAGTANKCTKSVPRSMVLLSDTLRTDEVLYFDVIVHNAHAESVPAFLAGPYRRLRLLTVVWDRSNIHSYSKRVKGWLARQPDVLAEDLLA